MSVLTKTGAVEVVLVGPIVDVNGSPLTGLTTIKAAVIRASDRKFLDWATMGFAAAPTTEYQALSELDATRAPGLYYLAIDTSTFVGAVSKDKYFVYVSQVGAPSAANALQLGEFRVGEVVDAVETNLDAQVSTRASSAALTAAQAAIIAEVDAKAAEIEGAGFSGTTDSLHAIRARGDAAWTTATGFAVPGSAMTLTAGERTATAGVVAPAVWDVDVVSGHGTASTSGLLLRALGAAIAGRANNATLGALLGVPDAAGATIATGQLDQAISGHTTAGTVGAALGNIGTLMGAGFTSGDDLHSIRAAIGALSIPTVPAIVDGVWAQTLGGYSAGSAGALIVTIGSEIAALPDASTIAGAVWTSTGLSALGANTAGKILTTRAAPGDAMTLAANSITSAVLATSAIQAVQAAILSDATPFAGATIAAINSGITGLPTAILDQGLSGHTGGGTVGGALSTASSYTIPTPPSAAAISAQVASDLSTAHGAGSWTTADVSAIATTAQLNTAVAGLPDGIWAAAEGTPSSGTMGWALAALRHGLTNKMAITTPGTLTLYADDSATPFLTWSGIRDGSGQPIQLPTGSPATRLKAA